jgi:uncharacterized membrane protein YozB (DUF420 family)
LLGCGDGKEFRKKRNEVEVDVRASWGAAVLRPYMAGQLGDNAGIFTNCREVMTHMFSQAALNATLNGTSAILLTCGYAAIRARKIAVHKAFMIAAFLTSTAFLISYLSYHYRVGHVAFQGQGWIRPVYFTLLLTHTVLAAVIVPMIIVTLRRAWLERFDKHRLIARWTLPLWLYVSVTGVIVYLMVYQIYPAK